MIFPKMACNKNKADFLALLLKMSVLEYGFLMFYRICFKLFVGGVNALRSLVSAQKHGFNHLQTLKPTNTRIVFTNLMHRSSAPLFMFVSLG